MKNAMHSFALLVALFPALAIASPFSTTEYECAQMNIERDGVKCAVQNIDGMGYTLMIRLHLTQQAPKQQLDRAKYLAQTIRHNFYANGGKWVLIRSKDKSGTEMERTCSRRDGRQPYCGDWYPAKDRSYVATAQSDSASFSQVADYQDDLKEHRGNTIIFSNIA